MLISWVSLLVGWPTRAKGSCFPNVNRMSPATCQEIETRPTTDGENGCPIQAGDSSVLTLRRRARNDDQEWPGAAGTVVP